MYLQMFCAKNTTLKTLTIKNDSLYATVKKIQTQIGILNYSKYYN